MLNQDFRGQFCGPPERTRTDQDPEAGPRARSALREALVLSAFAQEHIRQTIVRPQSQGAGSQHCRMKWHSWMRTKGQSVCHHTMERGRLCLEADGLGPLK